MTAAVLVTAAGSSTRLGTGEKKEYRYIENKPVLALTVERFAAAGGFLYYFVTVPPKGIGKAESILSEFPPGFSAAETRDRLRFVEGGQTRQESVLFGLRAMDKVSPDYVLIHDGARPWVTPECINAVLSETKLRGACAPVITPPDAIKRVDESGWIREHMSRTDTVAVQTPQGFGFADILSAHERAAVDGGRYIDDTEIYYRYIGPVASVPGDPLNRKITYLQDFPEFRREAAG